MFQKNESDLDKKIRLVVGIVALLLAVFVLTGTVQTVAYVVGVVAILTGLTGFCGLYKLFGISTKK